MRYPKSNTPTAKHIFLFGSFFLTICVFLFLALSFFLRPTHSPKYYYDIIRGQEDILSGTVFTNEERSALLACNVNNECLRLFFDNYTMKNGVEKAFSLLTLFEREYPERSRGCHYVAHGIGHAALRLNERSVSKTFSIMDSRYYKNIATCGNGYFHGVIEEFAKDVHDKTSLIALLSPVCDGGRGSCYHGIGHAASIQLNDDIPEALSVCDAVTEIPDKRFECYAGVFMQQASTASVTVKNGHMNFVMCDKQQGLARTACYLEQSSLYEFYSNNPDNYVRNIGFCKQITDSLSRMACIKLFAIRSVRIAMYEDVSSMCSNVSSDEEQIMCTAVTASKLANSIDKNLSDYSYRRTIWDICATAFNPLNRIRCFDLTLNRQNELFYTSVVDLRSVRISFDVYKNVYNMLWR